MAASGGSGASIEATSGDLPDLLPPQIPPRNSVVMRKMQDGKAMTGEVGGGVMGSGANGGGGWCDEGKVV